MKEIDLTSGRDESLGELLAPAALAIKNGDLVVLPTMTYYALAADALNPDAVRRVFSAKKRDRSKPLIVLVDSFEMMKPLVREIPAAVKELEWRLGSGGLTYVLHATEGVPGEVTADTGTIGVRIDRNEAVQCVLASVGQPITGPSANTEGNPPPRTCEDAVAQLRDWIEVAVRWWPAAAAAPSTIVDLTSDEPRVLREGTVSESDVRELLAR